MRIVGERASGEGSGMVVIVMDLYVQFGNVIRKFTHWTNLWHEEQL